MRTEPVFRASVLEEFIRLRDSENFTLTGAARAVGLYPSAVCGQGSALSRYLRSGLAGLERSRGGKAVSDLSRRLEELGWFVPAAQFFYLTAHRRRGALTRAVSRAAALPNLPIGWRRDTRARLLARLNLDVLPELPACLRAELAAREREGKPVPSRIARMIKTSPASIRHYHVEAPIADLARLDYEAISKRLAATEPEGNCQFTLEWIPGPKGGLRAS